jgi:two-component system nitrogen regulation response regulator GlnG
MKNESKKIFVVDDDKSIRWVLDKWLTKNKFSVECFSNAEDMISILKDKVPDVIISDIRMPNMSGIDMLDKMKREYPSIPIIIMTAFSDLETTVNSLKKGAYDYITKPFDINEVITLIEKACKNNNVIKKDKNISKTSEIPKIIGDSESMQNVYKSIGKIAQTDVGVLILGETGTGKELIARAIHESSSRKNNPFIAINTGAIPTELLESELFGHEKGSFTGAYSQRIGRFEQASDGTLFLDEIGDMPIDVQTRLLRVLQEGEFFRVGGSKSIKVKTRILTATHKDLKLLVSKDLFREDLLHRINAIKIELPSLKDRKNDIINLAEHFMKQYSIEYKVPLKYLTDDAKKVLKKYYWPGNIRELQNTCKFLAIMGIGEKISVNDLPKDILKEDQESKNDQDWSKMLASWILKEYDQNSKNISEDINNLYESILIDSALKLSNGNKTEAAKILGWGRNTISNKIRSSKN